MEEKAEKTAEGSNAGVSHPVQCGKDYKQFCSFRDQIQKGYKPIIYGDNYVVMDIETFKGLQKLANKAG